jgi:hypothetical protein
MFQYKQNLRFNPDLNELIQVVGIIPKGDSRYKETHYKIAIGDFNFIIPEEMAEKIFLPAENVEQTKKETKGNKNVK